MVTAGEVRYEADGLTQVGHLAVPDGTGRRPAVLIGHEGTGLNDFQRRRADHLAAEGYVALAMDYHGGRWFTDPQDMLARVMPMLDDPARMRAIGHAALDVLLAEPRADPARVAALGYGAGGTIALELGRDGVALAAVAAVNPALWTSRPEDAASIRCPVLVCTGSEDPIVTPEHRQAFAAEMQAAGVQWQLNLYGGAEHAFHHPPVNPDGSVAEGGRHRATVLPGVSYHPAHARRAWRDVLALLEETLHA